MTALCEKAVSAAAERVREIMLAGPYAEASAVIDGDWARVMTVTALKTYFKHQPKEEPDS